MSGKLAGRTALVTGGSRGIGAAIAERFATEGAKIAITYAGNKQAADHVIGKLRDSGAEAIAVRADAGDAEAAHLVVAEVKAAFGDLDILVHNAGVAQFSSIVESEEDYYVNLHERHFAVNVTGVVVLTKAAIPNFRDGGRIIIIGSVNSHQMPFAGSAVYGASKAAVAALARGWARDFGPRRILVNVIQPGPVNTDMNPADGREAAHIMTAMTALKRYGHPTEIASLAAFLASDEASYITGAAIDIDGGFSI